MNTKEIDDILRPLCKDFLGVFPSDHIPEGKGWSVINLDPCEKPGSHWVVLGDCEFFDSYGLVPLTRSLLEHLKRRCHGTKWWYNTTQLQDFNTKTCGHFCIFYIIKRCRGYSPFQIVNFLKSQPNVEKYVFNYVQKLVL